MAYSAAFFTAKLLGISYVTVLYFFLGLGVAKAFDAIYGEFDKSKYEESGKNMPIALLAADILLHVVFLAVVFYGLRNVVERIPFPLEGFGGYQHKRLKELEGGPILEFVGLFFQRNLKKKSNYFIQRVFGK